MHLEEVLLFLSPLGIRQSWVLYQRDKYKCYLKVHVMASMLNTDITYISHPFIICVIILSPLVLYMIKLCVRDMTC